MISNSQIFHLRNQRLQLLAEKALYWQKRNVLIVADLHIGKSAHFRKHGIAVPGKVNKSNLDKLSGILESTDTDHLVILGDLFHSDINREWEQFVSWRKNYRELEVSLVIGNHDILKKEHYHTGRINLFKKMTLDPFVLVHDINDIQNPQSYKHYILSGHIHPAVKLKGQGRQTLKLPCFYFGNNYGILPAIGNFTGTAVIEPKSDDRVFMIADAQIIPAENLNL